MAKSARSSVIKKNKSRLKSRVFGPVEQARAERLNKKLLELAQQAKPSDAAKMEVEAPEAPEAGMAEDANGTTDEAAKTEVMSNTAIKKARDAKKNKIEKKRVRKERNRISFKKHPMKNRR